VISSVPLSVLLTTLFAATGGYALLRWAALRSGLAAHGGDQVAELSHLVMSLAMLAMVWAYGGPAGLVVQLVAFSAFAAYFLGRLVRRRVGAAVPGCPAAEFHLLMSATMIWMVAGMPVLMGGSGSPGGADAGGHAGHGGHGGGQAIAEAGGGPVVPVAVPGWAVALTVASVAALLVAAAFWALRAVRSRPATPGATTNRLVTALTPRSEAVCHLAMSLGMAAMFVTMI
jgi:hypothetical protein